MTTKSDPYEAYDNGPNYPNGFEKRETTGGRTTPAIQEAIKHGAEILEADEMLTFKQPFHQEKIGGPGCCNPGKEEWKPPTKEQIAEAAQEGKRIGEDMRKRMAKMSPLYEKFTAGPQYCINKGWKVKGVFQDGEEMHGLVYNPHISTWFHLWWDLKGRCLTGNCRDGTWDLYPAGPTIC